MIQLYAITDHPGPALPDVAPLKLVPSDGLAAVCAPAGSREITPEALWRHEEVVEALMRDRDLLPVRYGTHLESAPAAAQVVADRHDELAAALDRVRGAVELSVRVAREDAPRQAGGGGDDGAGYMRAKARDAAQREAALRTVHEPLSMLAREDRRLAGRSGDELFRAAYLVDRPAVAGFTSLVARLERAHPALRLLCTGPWPPYSFVER